MTARTCARIFAIELEGWEGLIIAAAGDGRHTHLCVLCLCGSEDSQRLKHIRERPGFDLGSAPELLCLSLCVETACV